VKQTQALNVMMGGHSVFLTGAPGSGKTYVLRQFIQWAKAKNKRLAVTASTGIAATHIGGNTIHSWSGLGIRDSLEPRDIQWLSGNQKLAKRYNNTDVLIIDEVSMLHGKRLDMVNEVCKLLRESQKPFGGMQVILTGDLFQLPPVDRNQTSVDFAHTSKTWQELALKICYLTEQHRQSDDYLLGLLEAMRRDEIEEEHFEALRSRLGHSPPSGQAITKLYSHNYDVEEINTTHLAALHEDPQAFVMQTHGVQAKVDQLKKSVLAPEVLELKVGAEVMFVANNQGEGYVNGSRGKVIGFKDRAPQVKLQRTNRIVTVIPTSWALEEDGKEKARATQLPLRLAWAITIHKSQGMSLDGAEIDLSRAFTPGMGYVALSRVRSLDGIFLKGINNTALAMHPEIFAFDSYLKAESNSLAAGVPEELQAESANTKAVSSSQLDEQLLVKLKQWRKSEGGERHVPLYMIAGNKLLEALAINRPTSMRQLQIVNGMGPKIRERYGDVILKIIRDHLGVHTVRPDKQDKLKEFLAERGVYFSSEDLEAMRELLSEPNSRP
jgi:ATP-dependent DNA helicase PIF1